MNTQVNTIREATNNKVSKMKNLGNTRRNQWSSKRRQRSI